MSRSSVDAVEPSAVPYGPWGLAASLFLILTGAAAMLLLAGLCAFGGAALVYGFDGTLARIAALDPGLKDTDLTNRLNVVAGLAAYASVSCSILIAARIRGGRAWTELVAWTPWNPRRDLRVIAPLLVLVMFYSFGASAVIEHFRPEAKYWVPTPTGRPWIIGFLFLATFAAPITEELLFRGWIYTSLRRTLGVAFAILIVSVLFACAHWESTHFYALAVFPVGLALAYVRERTGSVAASITFHALYNGIASVLIFLAK